MTLLVIATLGATLLHIALIVWYFWHTFARYDQELPVALGVGISLTIMTSLGVASGVSTIWSDLHNGRGRGLGSVFAVPMLPGSLFFVQLSVPARRVLVAGAFGLECPQVERYRKLTSLPQVATQPAGWYTRVGYSFGLMAPILRGFLLKEDGQVGNNEYRQTG